MPAVADRISGLRRLGLSLLLSGGLLLAVPALAQASGVVEGKVVNASHTGVANVELRFYEKEGEWTPEKTKAGGEFSVPLTPGEYVLEIIPSSTYASEYYDEKDSFKTATRIRVEEGKTLKLGELAVSEDDTIEGIVTSAASGTDLAGIEVTAYEAEAPNEAVKSATTNEFGSYALTGLAKGRYVIGFKAALESFLNYAPQFFEGRPRFSEATTFDLVEHEKFTGIDAAMLKGGSITGVVTDAVSHAPIADAIAIALQSGRETPVAAGFSGASGAYTIGGLASGSYVVAFEPSSEEVHTWLPQVFDGNPVPESITSFNELLLLGTPVSVTAGVATPEINAALVRREPANTIAPVATGSGAVGQVLTCTNGTWTGIPTIVFSQQWLRDGTPIAGSTGSTYGVQGADAGHGLACQVTGTNELASTKAISNTIAIPAPAPGPSGPAPIPVLAIASTKATVSGGSARVPVSCTGAPCRGTIELTETLKVKVRHGGHRITKRETVVLAKVTYSLAAGAHATLSLRLSSRGRSALAAARGHRLNVTAAASVTGGGTARRAIVLGEPAPRRSHR